MHPPLAPRRPIERLIRPFQAFAANNTAGALLLMGATVVALVWANSPWAESYTALFATVVRVGVGDFIIAKPLLLWINDGLMSLFFFVMGLEIKRELLAGELSSARKAALPVAAAVGGMVVPAGVFLLLVGDGDAAVGWGVPMATDIAFALGVLMMVGPRVPLALKVFLTALAIVDDIGAILVIAIFYTEKIALGSLLVGAALFAVSVVANRLHVRSAVFYFILGLVVWTAFLKSGVHATLAAVLMAMTIPARTRIDVDALADRGSRLCDALRDASPARGEHMLTNDEVHVVDELVATIEKGTAPLQRLEHGLMPLVTFLVMPVFALANAGVTFGDDPLSALTHPLALGIVAGLFVGKQLGIFGFGWLAVKLGWADLPDDVGWRHIHAVAVIGGIGFTMSLFVGSLAFGDPALREVSKMGILTASVLSGVAGLLLLKRATPG